MNDFNLIHCVFADASKLADAWRLNGRWRAAHTLVKGLYPVSSALNQEAMVQLQLLEARILLDEATFGAEETLFACEEVLDRALTQAQTLNNASLIGAIWDAKGLVQHALYLGSDQNEEPKDELAYFMRGLTLRQGANDNRGSAESLFHVGLVYGVIRHDHSRALPYFEESYRLAKESDDLVMASYAIRHIGFARHDAGEGASAYAAMAESLQLRELSGFVPGVAMSLHTMAYAEAAYGNKEQAIVCLERAKSIFESLGVAKHAAWMASELEQFRNM